MTGLVVLLAALGLLLVPIVATRHTSLRPRSLSSLAVTSTLLASTMVVTTLAICAGASVEEHLVTSADPEAARSLRHLIPSAPLVGWLSLAIVVGTSVMALGSLASTLTRRHTMQSHLAFADIELIHDVPVATVPADEFLAAAVPGGRGCVLMSDGAHSRLSDAEVRAVLQHEEAHLRLGHHRHLLLARALDRSLWFVPGMRQAVRSLRTSVELAADASAGEVVGAAGIRSAIARAHDPGASVAVRRLHAVDAAPGSVMVLVLAWAVLVAIGGAAIGLEASWLGIGP